MTKTEIIKDHQYLIQIAQTAGEAIMSIYAKDDVGIKEKEDQSPLTLADELSHQAIVKGLEKYGIPILSEEGSEVSFQERSQWDLFWMIDPLDGTKEFIKKNGEFTVNIALIENGKPVFGVVSLPVNGDVYYGGEGFPGQFIHKGVTEDLLTKEKNPCQNVVVASKSHLNEETQHYIDSLEGATTIQVGSSLKFLMLARGKASVYPRFGPTMEWDTAAADAVIRSVDYMIKNIEGKPLKYNKQNLLNPYFIAK